jgi:hypothetical protein
MDVVLSKDTKSAVEEWKRLLVSTQWHLTAVGVNSFRDFTLFHVRLLSS